MFVLLYESNTIPLLSSSTQSGYNFVTEPKDVFDDSDADPNYNPDNDSSSDDENPCKRKKDDPASTSRSFVMQSPVLQGEKNVLKNRNIRIKGRYSQKGDTRVVRMDRRLKRNLEKAYITNNGKVVPDHERKPLTMRRMKCIHK